MGRNFGEVSAEGGMRDEELATRSGQRVDLKLVRQGVAIQEHPQHHHLVPLVKARRLDHPEPRPEPLVAALLARIEISLCPAKPEPTAVRCSQRVRQIVSMQSSVGVGRRPSSARMPRYASSTAARPAGRNRASSSFASSSTSITQPSESVGSRPSRYRLTRANPVATAAVAAGASVAKQTIPVSVRGRGTT